MHFAHSTEDRTKADWEPLDAHLKNVAVRTEAFAEKFGASPWGWAAGWLHDMGKAKERFQLRLLDESIREPHSGEGALFACKHYNITCPPPFSEPIGRIMAFAIAGHHAGLANGDAYGGGNIPLNERLETATAIKPWFDLARLVEIKSPPDPLKQAGQDTFGWAFFIRMLFSALVDADYLETERWFAETEGKSIERGWNGQLVNLKNALDSHIAAFGTPKDDLAKLRAEVLGDCRTAAGYGQDLFSLTVPTGGGKTLSSLAFALDHAIRHDLDRVIYVIPFTSVVEQTAAVFRNALDDDKAILEHHSAFDSEKLPGETNEGELEKLRLAAQNWDRPIIVTTAVQFFESLFANKPSRCRKLHNIARSVVILDEAQTMPLKLFRPCLAALNELKRGYNTSIVLCTATQPAVTRRAGLKAVEALEDVKEIIAPDRNLYTRLKRVRSEQAGVMTDDDLVEALGSVGSGLCIVNNRRHARELFQRLEKAGIGGERHLTTAMTAAHRRIVLDEIRQRLTDRKPVRLVSTSLIEAGVDISFSAVWRAWAGLDQVAQAAGRCNRENELGPEGGFLTIFEPEEGEGRNPPSELKQFADTARDVLRDHDDPLSEQAVAAYFRELLWRRSGADSGKPTRLDNVEVGERRINGIMAAIKQTAPRMNFCFADIAQAFRMIDSLLVPVIIPEAVEHPGASARLLERLRYVERPGGIARELQLHLVQVPRLARIEMIQLGLAETINQENFGDQFVVLGAEAARNLYHRKTGLDWDNLSYRDPESNMF